MEERWRARERHDEGGRFGNRGGADNPNVAWHTMRIKAAKAGPDQIKHFYQNVPKPQRTEAMIEWARLKNIAHAKGERVARHRFCACVQAWLKPLACCVAARAADASLTRTSSSTWQR